MGIRKTTNRILASGLIASILALSTFHLSIPDARADGDATLGPPSIDIAQGTASAEDIERHTSKSSSAPAVAEPPMALATLRANDKTDLSRQSRRSYREMIRNNFPPEWMELHLPAITPEMIADHFHRLRETKRSRCWEFLKAFGQPERQTVCEH